MVTTSQITAAKNKISRYGAPPPSTGRANVMPLVDYRGAIQTRAVQIPANKPMSKVFTGLAVTVLASSVVYLGLSPQKSRHDNMHTMAGFLKSTFQSTSEEVKAKPPAFYNADGSYFILKAEDKDSKERKKSPPSKKRDSDDRTMIAGAYTLGKS